MAVIRTLLGPFTVVLDYFSANPGQLIHLLTVWALIYLAGAIQLKQIEARSAELLLNKWGSIAEKSELTEEEIYKWFYRLWLDEFTKWKYWFIPHRTDLFPVKATPDRAANKIPLSSDWVFKTLNKNGIAIKTAAGPR
jgi:hypothetical protein